MRNAAGKTNADDARASVRFPILMMFPRVQNGPPASRSEPPRLKGGFDIRPTSKRSPLEHYPCRAHSLFSPGPRHLFARPKILDRRCGLLAHLSQDGSPARVSTSSLPSCDKVQDHAVPFLTHRSPALALPRATWLSKAVAAAGRTTCRNHVTSAPGPQGRQASP